MQYAAHLPQTKSLAGPLLALAIGAAAATGTYAILDNTDVNVEPTRVIVADAPVAPSSGVAAKDEAGTAASIGTVNGTSDGVAAKNEAGTAAAIGAVSSSSAGVDAKDEALVASSIGTEPVRVGGGPPAESSSAQDATRTDPHGPAAVTP